MRSCGSCSSGRSSGPGSRGRCGPTSRLPDLALVLWSFGPLIDATAEVAPNAWRRHLHWLLDGLRAGAATPQSEGPLSDVQLAEAMGCLRRHRFQRAPHPGGTAPKLP